MVRFPVLTIPFVALVVSSSSAWAVCPDSPDAACTPALSASFGYSDSDSNEKDWLSFKLSKVQNTAPGAFGDPTTTTAYELCLYSDNALLTTLTVMPDGDCDAGGCWRAKPKGPGFKDSEGASSGIQGITLVGTDDGSDKAKVGVKGAGENLPDLAVPLDEPITVQLRNSLDECWGESFSGTEVQQDSVKRQIKAKAKSKVFPTCSDGAANGYESDVDCGGSCGGCGYLEICNFDDDCLSGTCEAGQCAAGCTDGVTNGDETDVDCGGLDCDACGFGAACGENADCATNVCRASLCKSKRIFLTSTSYDGNLGGGCRRRCQV